MEVETEASFRLSWTYEGDLAIIVTFTGWQEGDKIAFVDSQTWNRKFVSSSVEVPQSGYILWEKQVRSSFCTTDMPVVPLNIYLSQKETTLPCVFSIPRPRAGTDR